MENYASTIHSTDGALCNGIHIQRVFPYPHRQQCQGQAPIFLWLDNTDGS